MKSPQILALLLLIALTAQAQLAVTVSAPKVTGQKAIVPLAMTNHLAEPVASARAVCFLLDDQGKMVGQSTKWVIGQNHATLEPKAGATFNFVITSPHPFTATNLTAKISFSRIVLDSGKLADVTKSVTILNNP